MNRFLFLAGLNLLCLSVLVLQIALTRIISVIAYFHLAFISISMAMLGLTAGAVWVYQRGITTAQLPRLLPRVCFFYGASVLGMMLLLSASFMQREVSIPALVSLAKIIFFMAVPFTLAGIAIALCLTRGPGKVGLRYAVDLVGAALGCLLCLPLLNTFTGPAVVLISGGIGIVAGLLFRLAGREKSGIPVEAWGIVLLIITVLTASSDHPRMSLSPLNLKTPDLVVYGRDFEKWNSFSQITVTAPLHIAPMYWGAGKGAPTAPQDHRYVAIDSMAGTPMYAFDGNYASPDYLRYDVTNLAYSIRHSGKSAVIGVGGGRDVLAARHFGFSDVTVVELNPIIVSLLTKVEPFVSFAKLGQDPNIHFNVDDGRSWFASHANENFNLIQMSMVDTLAATGAGSFTLSENGLYTIEGWAHFLNALAPDGVFTVSRWYAKGDLNETGRIVSLAYASLMRAGVATPRNHIYLAGTDRLATLLVAKSPFTAEELETLDRHADEMGFNILVRPGTEVASPVLSGILAAKTVDELQTFAGQQLLDVSAPTDARPFFFNQLRLFRLGSIKAAMKNGGDGTVGGNLNATFALLMVILFSALAVVYALLMPARESVRDVPRPYAKAGTSWFLLIGLGFMLVEIGTIQRMSIFLGHPVYGLAIVLFSLILLTGIGSFLSDHVRVDRSSCRLVGWLLVLGGILIASALMAPDILSRYEGADLVTRAKVAIGLIAPAALLMGFGFPVGMSLAEKIDPTPTPWFWSVNGAAGVLGSGLAVVISMNASIPATLLAGAACYLLLISPALKLARMGNCQAPTACAS